jgi:hypothetical protein
MKTTTINATFAKKTFAPTVGAVVEYGDAKWDESKPQVTAPIAANAVSLNVAFPTDGTKYVLTKMSSEEFDTHVNTLTPRLRVDYLLSHGSVLAFEENITNYDPEWYIGGDLPYILISWQDESGMWYEPLIYDTATKKILNN